MWCAYSGAGGDTTANKTLYVRRENQEVWDQAQETASVLCHSLSELVADMLAEYVQRHRNEVQQVLAARAKFLEGAR